MADKSDAHKGAHGGVRKGAGRKTRYECEKVDHHYSPVVSKPIFTRSLQGKPQQVTFTVSSVKAT